METVQPTAHYLLSLKPYQQPVVFWGVFTVARYIGAAHKTADKAIYVPYLPAMNEGKEVRALDQLYALRKQVVRLSLSGKAVMEIVALTGLSWTGVHRLAAAPHRSTHRKATHAMSMLRYGQS